MSAVLRLLILVPLGFVLAVVAAGLTVALAVFGLDPSGDTAGWIVLFTAWTAAYAGGFAFLPWLIAVVFAEGFGLRSVWFWFAVGGAIGAAAYAFTGFYGDPAEDGSGLAIHLAAGFVGGFAYWLVVGRNSGEGLVQRKRQASQPVFQRHDAIAVPHRRHRPEQMPDERRDRNPVHRDAPSDE